MFHIPIILGVKVAAAVYRSRVQTAAARAAAAPTSPAGTKDDRTNPGEQANS